ncbi:MAG: esterase [Winogradskyella sp.]|uniref:alpha/beta hydrolase n=1 Tax=Winogradskyella sp. TaxID=1883156 RepID=UPI001820F50F|nr:esterase [Winogradskyella sp.]
MKRIVASVFIFVFCINVEAQTKYRVINSTKLNEQRELKIQLPRNYDPKAERTYPIVVVLDGDYLFEPVVGNIDYQAYWEDIPDCIVVGVNQSTTRESDLSYDDETFFPVDNSADFYEFIAAEVLPFVEDNYKASKFRLIVGHNLSANYINYFLFKDNPLFRAYIVLSPDFAPEMINRLKQRLAIVKDETFYCLATADDDIKALRSSILECNEIMKSIENEKLNYSFNDFNDANHFSLVGQGIPKALNAIFSLYRPIDAEEYKEKLLSYDGSPYDYLINKYENIASFYGFEKEIIENDIRAIAAASKKKRDVASLEKLAKLIKNEFPNSMLSAYYMGMYYEMEGNLKKALLRYKSGLMLEPSQYIDKEMILEKMYDMEAAMKE